jgi:hypothetical protein
MRNDSVLVVYGINDGEIVHIHEQKLEGPSVPISKAEMEDGAIGLVLRNTGKDRTEFGTLHVSKEELRDDVEYKVDIQKKILVAKDSERKTTK